MDRQRIAHALEDLARDLDLVVFELEQSARALDGTHPAPRREGEVLRRRLERLRERMSELAERAAKG